MNMRATFADGRVAEVDYRDLGLVGDAYVSLVSGQVGGRCLDFRISVGRQICENPQGARRRAYEERLALEAIGISELERADG